MHLGCWLFCVKVRDIPYWLAPDETSLASARNSRHRRTASLTRPRARMHTRMHARTHACKRNYSKKHAGGVTGGYTVTGVTGGYTVASCHSADAHSAAMCTIRPAAAGCAQFRFAALRSVSVSSGTRLCPLWLPGFSSRGWSWPKSSIRLAVQCVTATPTRPAAAPTPVRPLPRCAMHEVKTSQYSHACQPLSPWPAAVATRGESSCRCPLQQPCRSRIVE